MLCAIFIAIKNFHPYHIRMKKVLSVFLILILTLIFIYHRTLEHRLIESILNHSTQEIFANTIKIQHVELDSKLRLFIRGLTGMLKTEDGPEAIQVDAIQSTNSLLCIFAPQGVQFKFSGARPVNASEASIDGAFVSRVGADGFSELTANIRELDLKTIQWVNPDNLAGSTGKMQGVLQLRNKANGESYFSLQLEVKQPGGNLQARFFNLILPYLPQAAVQQQIREIKSNLKLVPYSDAVLKAEQVAPDRMKVFLHIGIPVYNLALNLNIDVRLDEENAFNQLAQVAGLIKVES
jgi:hypothetical protein